ncbi:HlyD family efflux transporter periplasmic adaptor subunit [Propionicimonas sp.]|uniref:HlyD family efflux transporter periplasmic adaptor subunit n=1 Tax=Propionicimonas sp. TaxID=1955623 RepID=UPI0039E2C0FB
MSRRRVLLNVGLGAAVLVVAVAGVVALASPRQTPTITAPTATVARGTLAATVTASGNVHSGVTASLQLAGSGGIVTHVYVRTGEKVTAGDRLVAVDDTAARQQLASAQASLRSAQGSLTTTTQGRTSAEKRSDSASVASARQALTNAQKALDAARDSYQLVLTQQNQLVAAAQDAVDTAQDALAAAQAALTDLQAELAATDPADSATIADLNARIATARTQVGTDQSSLGAAESALASAQRTHDSQVLQARQAVTSQKGSRDAARKALAQTTATVAVNQQGPRSGAVTSAEAQVASAQVAVDQARTAVEDTVLRAPFSGTVSTVNAVAGQSSSTAGATGTTTSGSGLVTLVNPSGLSVSASIAEADATSVKVGQQVSVELEASGVTMRGTVASIDPSSTVTNNVVQYATTIALVSPPSTVRVGQTASITITTGTRDDVLSVPTSAIATDGSQPYVIKVAEGRESRVDVTTGMTGTTGTEITSGLAEGDEVLLSNTGEPTVAAGFPGPGQSTAR